MQNINKLPIYLFNTEPYPDIQFEKTDNLFCLASGFIRFYLTYYTKPNKIIIYDINKGSIDFHKELDELLDISANNIFYLYQKYSLNYNFSLANYMVDESLGNVSNKFLILESWLSELEKWNSDYTFYEAFKYYKSIQKEYRVIDILSAYKSLFKDTDKLNAIFISNFWDWEYNDKDNFLKEKEKKEFHLYLNNNNIKVLR